MSLKPKSRPTFVKRLCSGDDQYLEHLLALLEVLEPILENDNENLESVKGI
jgi:hypothetical protein